MKNPKPVAVMSAAAPLASVAAVACPSDAARLPNPVVAETMREFEELDEEAAEMGVAPPSAEAKAVAGKILAALLREFPRYYAVSPGEGRQVAIETGDGAQTGRGVLIVCDDDGVSCHVVRPDDNDQSVRRCSADGLPDDFIRRALRELA